MALSDAAVRRNSKVEKPTKLADGQGLYLLINPSGSKLWRLKYRLGGKEKTLSIGPYPDIALAEAREKAQEARKQIAQGIDPSRAKQEAKREQAERDDLTFSKVAGRWFAKWEVDKGESTIRRARRNLRYLESEIGGTPIDRLRVRDVSTLLEKIETERSTIVAREVGSVLERVLAYARTKGLIETNPASGMRSVLSSHQGSHHAATTEESSLGEVLRGVWGYSGYGLVDAALKLLPYLFTRPAELLSMRWADVDFERKEWRYTASKTGAEMVVPLADQVIEILMELKMLTGRGDKAFPGVALSTLPNAMLALGLGGKQTCHGWRATARTILDQELGFRPDWIEHQLGHRVKDALGRAYNRTSHLEGRRGMMQTWADYLDRVRLGKAMGGNVVDIRRAG